MERLTEKIKNGNEYTYFSKDDKVGTCCNKLGKCEDIEEELGIDLITLFEALSKKRGFLFKSKKRKQWVVNPTGYDITLEPKEFVYYVEKGIFECKKTKEELK